jgi:hypothetical protein
MRCSHMNISTSSEGLPRAGKSSILLFFSVHTDWYLRSLIAIMLGRLRMTIEEAIAAYKDLSPKIFKKKWWTQNQPMKYFGAEMQHYWFEGRNLEDAVQELLTGRNLDLKLKLWESDDPLCRVYVLPIQLPVLEMTDGMCH